MNLKSALKIGALSIFIIAIIISGLIMFQRLNYNKQVFDTDIYLHIPKNATSIIQVNKAKDLPEILPFAKQLEPIIKTLEKNINFPCLVLEFENDYYFVSKLTVEQESKVENLLSNKIFTSFAAKERIYKETRLSFFPTENNNFFVSMFYKGMFVCGFNYKLLENIIDTHADTSFFEENENILKKAKNTYSANIFKKNDNQITVLNLNFEEATISIEGYTAPTIYDKWPCPIQTSDSLNIDYKIFPDSLVSYQIDRSNAILSDTLICMFNPPIYQFRMTEEQIAPIFAIKHNCDRFDIYKLLNRIEQAYGHPKFSTRDVVMGKQHIYTTSIDLARNQFKHESPVYLTFYNGYLLFCADRSTLVYYLKYNGNYQPENNSPEWFLIETKELESLFYSKDLSKWAPGYSNLFENPIIKNIHGTAFVKLSVNDNEKNIGVVLQKK